MKWRPHTEKPDTTEPVTALLAGTDEEMGHPPYLFGIYLWKRGEWVNELTGVVATAPFWWALEADVIATLEAR